MNTPASGVFRADTARLDRIAYRLALECELLAASSDTLQDEIGHWLNAASIELDSQTILSLQEADRISQTLRSLARLAAGIAPDLEGMEIARDKVRAEIGLESVAHRLLED